MTTIPCILKFILLLGLSSGSMMAQNRIEAKKAFENFLTSIDQDDFGILWISDGKCGECLLAMDSAYLAKADSVLGVPTGLVVYGSGFGKTFAMRYRINQLPSVLVFDASGHLLRRVIDLPKTVESLAELRLPFDTLPKAAYQASFDDDYPEFFKASFSKHATSTVDQELLNLYFAKNRNLTNEVTWAVAMRFDLSETMMNRIIVESDTLIDQYGKDEVYKKIDDHLFDQLKQAARKSSEDDFQTVLGKTELAFGNDRYPYIDKYKSYYYQLTGNWNAFVSAANELHGSKTKKSETLYQMAEVLIRNSEKEELFAQAAKWFRAELSPENQKYADIKSILLYKSGNEEGGRELAANIKKLPNYSAEKLPYSSMIPSK